MPMRPQPVMVLFSSLSVCGYAPLAILLVLLVELSSSIVEAGSMQINIPNAEGHSLTYYLCTTQDQMHDVTYVLQSNITHSFDPQSLLPNDSSGLCIVNNSSNITIRSSHSELQAGNGSFANINCSQNAGLGFANVPNLRLINIRLINCGGGLSKESVKQLNERPTSSLEFIQIPYPDFNLQTRISLLFIDCPDLYMHSVTVAEYQGFGIIVKNLPSTEITLKSITVTNAVSEVNGTGLTIINIANSASTTTSYKSVQLQLSDITITNGWTAGFNDGLINEIDTRHSQPVVRLPAGLALIVVEPTHNPPDPVYIDINDLTVHNNSDGGMLIMFTNIVNSSVSINRASISSNCLKVEKMVPELDQKSSQELIGESLTVYYAVTEFRPHSQEDLFEDPQPPSLVLQDTDFMSSKSDGCRSDVSSNDVSRVFALPLVLIRVVGIYVGQRSRKNQNQYINLSNVSFSKDYPGLSFRDTGIGLSVYSYLTIIVTLQNITSRDFSCIDTIPASMYNSYYSCVEVGSLSFNQMKRLNVVGGVFTDHKDCSVFYAQESDIYFTGNILIDNNQGVIYGAVQFVKSSTLFFQEPLSLEMTNNRALYGATLYVYEKFSINCALQVVPQPGKHYDYRNFTEMDIQLLYDNNIALLSGNTIYANLLHHCGHEVDQITTNSSYPHFFIILSNLIHPKNSNESVDVPAEISSPPDLICICRNATDQPELPCNKNTNDKSTETVFSVYSGETVTLYLIAADGSSYVFGVVTARLRFIPANVSVHLNHQDISSSIGFRGKENELICSKVEYLVYHNVTGGPVNITLELAPMEQLSHTVITLTLKSCPPGLQLNYDRTCDCLPVFPKEFHPCSVNGTIQRPEHVWIGYTSKHEFGYSRSCPDGLCNDILTSVTILPSLQERSPMCNGFRTGTLCAECPPGTSVTFGSVDCIKCSNWYLFTILFFAVCGMILVALLFVLQLTVKVGTVNGVIFYANLFAYGFTTGYLETHHYLYLLKLFVAFINLDLGFPLCFYNGMTEEVHHLLEFVFPVYVWTIIGLIIYASKHSIKLSKLTGRHSVAVLATLIQLSYSNIMSNIASSFPWATIMTDNSTYYVWFAAANVEYGSTLHIIHMIISVLFLLLFILPYTLLLTLAPFAGRYRIVSKLMPYLDVIYAPYKERWRCWFGLRLCLLVVLLVIQAGLSGYSFKINLGAKVVLVMVFTLFQIHYKPFKNLFVHCLDVFYMLNFCLSGFMAISVKTGPTLVYVIVVLISSSFVVFLGILTYHVYMVLRNNWTSKRLEYNQINESDAISLKSSFRRSTDSSSSVTLSQAPSKTVYDQLREPILDYTDDSIQGIND